jgi:3-hydroxyacyl-[acyl-carrier-protein] dehydratase
MLDSTQIERAVVHAQPMDALGQVVRASASELTAVKHLAASERVFKGHFPHYPVLPGVMLLEAIVQAVRWQAAEQGWRVRLMAIDSVRWHTALRPGATYETSCKFVREGASTKVSARITAEGRQVATCSSRWSMLGESC